MLTVGLQAVLAGISSGKRRIGLYDPGKLEVSAPPGILKKGIIGLGIYSPGK